MGADGAASAVAKHFSIGTFGRHALTYKAVFNTRIADTRDVDLFFDRKTMPGFFGWMCPNSKDRLEVGLGISSNSGNSRAAFNRFMHNDIVKQAIGSGVQLSGEASIIPLSTRKALVDEKHGVILVGDAAGQVKASTGGGIIFGGNAAIIAADAIKAHIERGESLRVYESEYRKRFSFDALVHRAVRNLYSGTNPASLAYVLKAMKFMHIDKFLGKYGEMDLPSLMLGNVLSKRGA